MEIKEPYIGTVFFIYLEPNGLKVSKMDKYLD